ncbi:MAG TPA: hypothetical protein VJ799_05205 [Nitrososphaeraceae archaeon]|nr:hypothetical protein [Nitrososphaeraceae archaeon]
MSELSPAAKTEEELHRCAEEDETSNLVFSCLLKEENSKMLLGIEFILGRLTPT